MVPLGMEVQSFIQQYSTNFENPIILKSSKELKLEKKQYLLDEKNKNDTDIITDLNTTMKTSWRMQSKNSLPRVRETFHQNDDVIPRNILSSKFLKPLINTDALKTKTTLGLISVCDWIFCSDSFCIYQMCLYVCMYVCMCVCVCVCVCCVCVCMHVCVCVCECV